MKIFRWFTLVLLLFMIIPVICLADEEPAGEALGSASYDEMTFELISLKEGPEGGLDGILRCTNLTDQAVSLIASKCTVNDICFHNGIGFGGIWTAIPSKESLEVEFSIADRISMEDSDETGEEYMILKDPLGFFGEKEISSISFFLLHPMSVSGRETETVHIELTEPFSYESFSDLSEENDTVPAFEDERICIRIVRMGVIEDMAAMSVLLENKTDQDQIYDMDGFIINDAANFEALNENLAHISLKAGTKEYRHIGLGMPSGGYVSPFKPKKEDEQQTFLASLKFGMIHEDPDTQDLHVSDIKISLPEPLYFRPDESDEDISPADEQEKGETPATLTEVICEEEADDQPPLFEAGIGLPENAADQRLVLSLTFNTPLTEDEYNDIESVYAIIQLRNTDPEWLNDIEEENGMLVRPVSRVLLHPDGKGGFGGVYSGLVPTAGDSHLILPMEEDGLGEDVISVHSLNDAKLGADERFNVCTDDHQTLEGTLHLDVEIRYQDGQAVLSDYSVIAEKEGDRNLTKWPISRFAYISNGSSGMYRYWQPDQYGFYDMLTQLRYQYEDMSYPISNETVCIDFVPFNEIIGENDEITSSYEINFYDGTVLRLHFD